MKRTKRKISLGACGIIALGSLVGGAGCKKDTPTPPAGEVPPATVGSGEPREAAGSLPSNEGAAIASSPATEAAPAQALSEVPSAFDGGEKVSIKNAVGIGCEATAKGTWLKLLCWKKNSTGGKPVRALFASAADAAASKGEPVPPETGLPVAPNAEPSNAAASVLPSATAAPSSSEGSSDGDAGVPTIAVLPEEKGELIVLVPWATGRQTAVRIEWTDVAYDLIVEGTSGELKRPANIAIRKACAQLTNTADGLVANAKKSGALQQADGKDLPKFGRCQLAGTGAWAIALDSITASGSGSARSIGVKLSAVHLDEAGAKVTAPFAQLAFAPGGLAMPTPMIFDYDADGSHELIVRYELTGRPEPMSGALAAPPGILTFRAGKVEPFAVGAVTAGSFSVEQLDKDMRPDVADYGPFTAWLSKSCGAAKCPSRIQGPRFFLQSKSDGTFDRAGEGAKAALKRACAQKPTTVVVAGAQGVNVQSTAERVACARAWQVASAEIEKQLLEAKSKLCTTGDTCELLTTLQSWAAATAPTVL
jgi:hypothetical protein